MYSVLALQICVCGVGGGRGGGRGGLGGDIGLTLH